MPTDCKYVCCCTAWILLYSEDIFHENSHVRLNSPLSCGAVAFRFLWFAAHHVFSFFLFFEFNCKYVKFWGGSVCALLFFYIRIPKCIRCCRNASVKMPFFLFFFFYSLIRIVVLVLLPLFWCCKYFTREKWKTVNLFYDCVFCWILCPHNKSTISWSFLIQSGLSALSIACTWAERVGVRGTVNTYFIRAGQQLWNGFSIEMLMVGSRLVLWSRVRFFRCKQSKQEWSFTHCPASRLFQVWQQSIKSTSKCARPADRTKYIYI